MFDLTQDADRRFSQPNRHVPESRQARDRSDYVANKL